LSVQELLQSFEILNRILEINPGEKWARVEPGVVLDEQNMALKPYGLFFDLKHQPQAGATSAEW
jgi:FAD/FMN-containing dehydrogenase